MRCIDYAKGDDGTHSVQGPLQVPSRRADRVAALTPGLIRTHWEWSWTYLLAVAGGLLEGLDEASSSGRNDGAGGLSVLDGELDGHAKSSPVLLGGLGDILTDLLGGETKGTDLGGQGGGGTHLTTGDTEENL